MKVITFFVFLKKKNSWLKGKAEGHAYVVSFIIPNKLDEASDNLVFWRTYGREGEGCSLSLLAPRSILRKVFYGTDQVSYTAEKLQSFLDLLDPILKIDNLSKPENIQRKLAESFWNPLEKIRYLYKSDAYKYENECRFVILESDIDNKNRICLEYQERNYLPPRIRHYYEHEDFHIKKLMGTSASTVTIGPCVPYSDNVHQCIEILKKRAALESKIKISNIIYRKY